MVTRTDLDNILADLCQLIIVGQKKDSELYGLVAACVLDPAGNKVMAVNYFNDGDRVHGERAAIDKYIKQNGKIPKGSIIITTLSPCSKKMDDRVGCSCTDLIDSLGIKQVYCGYIDPTQDDSVHYGHKKFKVTETKNKKIRELCKQIADTFIFDMD